MRKPKAVSFDDIREAKVQNPWCAFEYGYPSRYLGAVVVVVAKSGRTARLLAMRAVFGEGGSGDLTLLKKTPIAAPGSVVFEYNGEP